MRVLTIAATLCLFTSGTALVAQAKPVTRGAYINTLNARFGGIDTNHDGIVSAAEMAAEQQKEMQQAKTTINQQLSARFKQLDTNKDNQLNLQEFLAAAPGIRASENSEQLLQRLDANKDGKLSADEFRNPQLATFDKADANHDGTVTPAEMQAVSGKK
jgi:Ca2+-binding EF-hand superfamily protein